MAYRRISIDEAKALVDAGGVTIGDVRDADSFSVACIENAIHVAHETMDEFLAVTDKNKPLLLYCYHGNSSQGAANYFSERGFVEIYSMDGGFEAWRQKY
jgi:thiosulfate sulfurtransferase